MYLRCKDRWSASLAFLRGKLQLKIAYSQLTVFRRKCTCTDRSRVKWVSPG